MGQFLALDIETGGIGTDKTLLSAFFAIVDEEFNIVDTLDLKIKPDDGIYHITAQGMGVNKINIVEHDKVAITYKEAGTALYNFLSKHPSENKLIPLGHGVAFDCNFLQNTIISSGSWNKFVSYRTLDSSPIARYLMIIGLLPQLSGSLESLITHFNIEHGTLHDAKNDVLGSIEVMKWMVKLGKAR
jgi:DNA polymerase III alpha subunit (gram-positive type)